MTKAARFSGLCRDFPVLALPRGSFSASSRTPRRASTRIALHAGAVPHQREMAALAAHFAFVALGLGFGAAFGLARLRGFLLRSCAGARPTRLDELAPRVIETANTRDPGFLTKRVVTGVAIGLQLPLIHI